ncbi:MAG: carboxymuconolactone decarboxylase family protein [Pararhizobium sp.]
MSPEQRKVFDAIVDGPRGAVIGPLRAALHNPELASRWQQLGEILRYRTTLPARLSELAIVVTARRWNSPLEWTVHAEAARKAGLPETVLSAINAGEVPKFGDPQDAEVYAFSRELQLYGEVSSCTYAALHERWRERGVVELTAIIGYYTMVSMTLNAHHIPLPSDMHSDLIIAGETSATPCLAEIPAADGA